MPLIFTDQLGHDIQLPAFPKRIISLVPSQTELMFDLGLDEQIVGITKFCVHPSAKVRDKRKIGGTKQLNLDLIRELKPDLIIGNKEENERTQIETLMHEFPVWMSDIASLPEALTMIKGIGQITGTIDKAYTIISQISNNFNKLLPNTDGLRVAYLIWQRPFMTAGKGTFINDMLQRCGFVNVFEQERYPEFDIAELQHLKPDVIMLSSEPYPFRQKHIDAFIANVPDAKVMLVDGEMFSWYGSRMLQASAYFKQLIAGLRP